MSSFPWSILMIISPLFFNLQDEIFSFTPMINFAFRSWNWLRFSRMKTVMLNTAGSLLFFDYAALHNSFFVDLSFAITILLIIPWCCCCCWIVYKHLEVYPDLTVMKCIISEPDVNCSLWFDGSWTSLVR